MRSLMVIAYRPRPIMIFFKCLIISLLFIKIIAYLFGIKMDFLVLSSQFIHSTIKSDPPCRLQS